MIIDAGSTGERPGVATGRAAVVEGSKLVDEALGAATTGVGKRVAKAESTNFARVPSRATTTEFTKLVGGAESIVNDATGGLAEELDSECAEYTTGTPPWLEDDAIPSTPSLRWMPSLGLSEVVALS